MPEKRQKNPPRTGVRPEISLQRPHHAFRKGFVSGLARLGADRDAVEYLVGHSLALRGIYVDPNALPLRAAVEKIPPVGAVGVVVPFGREDGDAAER
jgi:site-specific recombinase XerD